MNMAQQKALQSRLAHAQQTGAFNYPNNSVKEIPAEVYELLNLDLGTPWWERVRQNRII